MSNISEIGLPSDIQFHTPRDRDHEDLDVGGPRRSDDREPLLYALDEDDGHANVVYQVALARVDVEDVPRSTELLAGGLVLEARFSGIRIVGPEHPGRLAVRAGDLVENAGGSFPLAWGEAAGELATVRDRVDPAAVQDVATRLRSLPRACGGVSPIAYEG